jgi:hypothetical protein
MSGDGVSDFVLDKLIEDIEIIVSVEAVSVSYRGRLERLKPVVYISKGKTNPVVLAVGDSNAPAEPHVQVDLFGSSASFPKALDKGIILEEFFVYIFRDLLRLNALKLLIRPRVVLKGASSLDSILCGYQKALLRAAVIKAGARECVFDS